MKTNVKKVYCDTTGRAVIILNSNITECRTNRFSVVRLYNDEGVPYLELSTSDYESVVLLYDELSNYLVHNGTLYDPADFCLCELCSKVEPAAHCTTLASKLVCKTCATEKFFHCAHCDSYHLLSEVEHRTVQVYDSSSQSHYETWCERCTSLHAAQCDDCEEWVDTSHIRYYNTIDRTLCDNCREDNYFYCDDCDQLFHINDGTWVGDYHVCYSCESRRDSEAQKPHVRGYYKNPVSRFCLTDDDDANETHLIGVELETEEGDTPERCELVWEMGCQERYLYMKEDGSLDDDTGVEIVTQPMSKRFFDAFGWEQLFAALKETGARSHNTSTCGLHVHLSRTWFGDNSEEQELIAGIVVDLMDKFEDKLTQIARRKSNYYYRYPSDSASDDYRYLQDMDLAESHDDYKASAKKMGKCCTSRYRAFNRDTCKPTYEFRIFRGTLNAETFRASIDLSIRLVEYAKLKNSRGERNYTWKEFLDFAPLTSHLKRAIARLVKN